jgi:hypothetical protein
MLVLAATSRSWQGSTHSLVEFAEAYFVVPPLTLFRLIPKYFVRYPFFVLRILSCFATITGLRLRADLPLLLDQFIFFIQAIWIGDRQIHKSLAILPRAMTASCGHSFAQRKLAQISGVQY